MKKENLLQNTVYHLLRFSVQLNAAFADFIPITFARSGSWPNNVVIEPPPEAKKIEKRRDFQKTLYSLMYIYVLLYLIQQASFLVWPIVSGNETSFPQKEKE